MSNARNRAETTGFFIHYNHVTALNSRAWPKLRQSITTVFAPVLGRDCVSIVLAYVVGPLRLDTGSLIDAKDHLGNWHPAVVINKSHGRFKQVRKYPDGRLIQQPPGWDDLLFSNPNVTFWTVLTQKYNFLWQPVDCSWWHQGWHDSYEAWKSRTMLLVQFVDEWRDWFDMPLPDEWLKANDYKRLQPLGTHSLYWQIKDL